MSKGEHKCWWSMCNIVLPPDNESKFCGDNHKKVWRLERTIIDERKRRRWRNRGLQANS